MTIEANVLVRALRRVAQLPATADRRGWVRRSKPKLYPGSLLPILHSVLIEAGGRGLLLTFTDLDHVRREIVPIATGGGIGSSSGEQPWRIAVNAVAITRLLAACGRMPISLCPSSVDGDGRLEIRWPDGSARLVAFSADDWPTYGLIADLPVGAAVSCAEVRHACQ